MSCLFSAFDRSGVKLSPQTVRAKDLTFSKTVHYPLHVMCQVTHNIMGVPAKPRPPETLNCSKFKTCWAKKLKLYQPVYLIS